MSLLSTPYLQLSYMMALCAPFLGSHENVSGFYRVSAYFVSKIFLDLIPMRMLPCLLFSSIIYFMIGMLALF